MAGGSGENILQRARPLTLPGKKDSEWEPTHYYDANAYEITLNPGKTWICIIQDTNADQVEIAGPEPAAPEAAENPDAAENPEAVQQAEASGEIPEDSGAADTSVQ